MTIPADSVQDTRGALALGQDWAAKHRTWTDALRELQGKTEEAGVMVAMNSIVDNNTYRKLDPREFRGFVIVDEYAPLVFINGADAKAAQMFTQEPQNVRLGLVNASRPSPAAADRPLTGSPKPAR